MKWLWVRRSKLDWLAQKWQEALAERDMAEAELAAAQRERDNLRTQLRLADSKIRKLGAELGRHP
jgi:uncharacterized protein (DUF3084 family)